MRTFIIFHNGDLQPTNIFYQYPCTQQSVHILGLKKGSYLFSSTPYYLQKQDGVMIGINDTFYEFFHYDSNHQLINTHYLFFISNCVIDQTHNPITEGDLQIITSSTLISIFALFSLLILIVLLNRIIRKRVERP